MRVFLPAAASTALALLGGCQLLDSERVLTGLEAPPGAACHSNAGTYHLPRRLVVVRVSQGPKPSDPYAIEINPGQIAKYAADRNEVYCLDFLLTANSEDRIGVARNELGLLERVFTKVSDKTLEVALKTIQAVADLSASRRADSLMRVSGRPEIAVDDRKFLASFEFDPFVERESREANEALAEFGYCLYLDRLNDPFAPAWSQEICQAIAENRKARLRSKKGKAVPEVPIFKSEPSPVRSGLAVVDPNPVSKEWQSRGILYRPELAHNLVIVRQPDPGAGSSPWRVAGSERITMPNAAPAFVMEVKRAAFVSAETDIQFNNGMIKSVTINKPSELLAFSNFTVAVAQIVVSIPARTLEIFKNRADNTEALIQANSDLIATLRGIGADPEANDQVRLNNELLGRAAGGAASGRSINPYNNPASVRFAECLRLPDSMRSANPVQYCQELVNRKL